MMLVRIVHLLAAVAAMQPGDDLEQACVAGGSDCLASEGVQDDDPSLLQVPPWANPRKKNNPFTWGASCPDTCHTDTDVSQNAALIKNKLGGDPIFGWWTLPVVSYETQEKLQQQFEPVDLSKLFDNNRMEDEAHWFKFGQVGAAEAAQIMWEGTKVPGVYDVLPDKFRGVYWMQNDGLPEELVVLQYSKWFEEENQLIWTEAPFSYAWAYGKPFERTLSPNPLYTKSRQAEECAGHVMRPSALSYQFSTCPKEGKYCQSWAQWNNKQAFGNMQLHSFGNLSEVEQVGDQLGAIYPGQGYSDTTTGAWSLEEKDFDTEGKLWKRTVNYGEKGCDCTEFGSYDLTKIIDENGNKVWPWFQKFVDYMGDVPILMWTGFSSEENQAKAQKYYDKLSRNPHKWR